MAPPLAPCAASTAQALIHANGTARDDRDGAANIVNATASCDAPCDATGTGAALASLTVLLVRFNVALALLTPPPKATPPLPWALAPPIP